jgi:hypothetical protein
VQRIALLVLVLFIIWKLLSVMGKRHARAGAEDFSKFSARSRERRRRQQEQREADRDLAACALCGTNVPVDRMLIASGGEQVCSPECRDRLGQRS